MNVGGNLVTHRPQVTAGLLFRAARRFAAREGCGRCTSEVQRGPRVVGVQSGRAEPRDVRANVENGQEAGGCQLMCPAFLRCDGRRSCSPAVRRVRLLKSARRRLALLDS